MMNRNFHNYFALDISTYFSDFSTYLDGVKDS